MERDTGNYCLMAVEFVWDNKNVLERDNGDGYTTLDILIAAELYNRKMVQMVNYCCVDFTTIETNKQKNWTRALFCSDSS